MASLVKEFTKGLWSEVPLFRLVLGLCPALAVTNTAENGLGMGLAATFVLVCSNMLVSMLRKVIPNEVRVACYIVIIATFVVCVEMITKAYFFTLYENLGLFIPDDFPTGHVRCIGTHTGECQSVTIGQHHMAVEPHDHHRMIWCPLVYPAAVG